MPRSFRICFIGRKEYLSPATYTGKGPFLHQALPIPGFVDMQVSTWELKNGLYTSLSKTLGDTKQMKDGAGGSFIIMNVDRIDL